ncbi:hypothetical protein ZWY2020_040443 [Hordeum vulgare]|nr:hypothetical protein ZWY2020_040443 [Hordeum vulgare]
MLPPTVSLLRRAAPAPTAIPDAVAVGPVRPLGSPAAAASAQTSSSFGCSPEFPPGFSPPRYESLPLLASSRSDPAPPPSLPLGSPASGSSASLEAPPAPVLSSHVEGRAGPHLLAHHHRPHLCYTPETGCVDLIPAPQEVGDKDWEIGEMEGNLCVACVDQAAKDVAVLYMAPGDQVNWAWAGQFHTHKMGYHDRMTAPLWRPRGRHVGPARAARPRRRLGRQGHPLHRPPLWRDLLLGFHPLRQLIRRHL